MTETWLPVKAEAHTAYWCKLERLRWCGRVFDIFADTTVGQLKNEIWDASKEQIDTIHRVV